MTAGILCADIDTGQEHGMTAYSTLHWRLRYKRGPASQLQCVRCPEQARDWAQTHGTDGEDIWADYEPMCRKCHIAYDGSGHHTPHTQETKDLLSRRNRGYQHTPEAIEKIRQASLARGCVPPWHPDRKGGGTDDNTKPAS